jgi:hypothetical protein
MAAREIHATIQELLEVMFSMQSVPRLYNKQQLRLQESLGTEMRTVEDWCEIAASLRVSCETVTSQYVHEHIS